MSGNRPLAALHCEAWEEATKHEATEQLCHTTSRSVPTQKGTEQWMTATKINKNSSDILCKVDVENVSSSLSHLFF